MDVAGGGGLSTTAANLLIEILRGGVYSNDQSSNIDALAVELGVTEEEPDEPVIPDEPDEPVTPEKTLSSISATYSGGDVAVGTAVTDLTGIVVTATYSDGSTATVTDYTLSGEIAEGGNTITVSYGGKTTTFTVAGMAESGDEDEPENPSAEIPADATRLAYIESTGTQYIDTEYQPAAKDTIEMTMETTYAGTTARVDWFGVYDGTNSFRLGTNLAYVFWGRCIGANVSAPGYATVFGDSGNALKFKIISDFGVNNVTGIESANVVFYNTDGTKLGQSAVTAADKAVFNDLTADMYLFAINNNGNVGRYSSMKLYECIFRDVNGAEVHHYVPVKDTNNVVCLYDTVDKRYLYNAGSGAFVGGEVA